MKAKIVFFNKELLINMVKKDLFKTMSIQRYTQAI